MIKTKYDWMKDSIELINIKNKKCLYAGIIFVNNNRLLFSDVFSDKEPLLWLKKLKIFLKCNNISHVESVYLTTNIMCSTKSFLLSKIFNLVTIGEIYVGLPDPRLTLYLKNDPMFFLDNIKRYPDDLQNQIIKINNIFYGLSSQNIKNIPYYANLRISTILLEELERYGILIDKSDLVHNKKVESLINILISKYNLKQNEAEQFVKLALSKSFNKKYSNYDYKDDARFERSIWIKEFNNLYHEEIGNTISHDKIINVGVGGGNEAVLLFSSCKNIVFVDIAEQGLKRVKQAIPQSKIFCLRAEELTRIKDNVFNVYISLRTYNSSFFDVKKALLEAKRVLTHKGKIILSISNGFLNPQTNKIISGLLVPNTDFIDLYRGLSVIEDLVKLCESAGYINCKTKITKTEIYLVATNVKQKEKK